MISKEDAMQIAKDECSKNGWEWNEQTKVKWGLFNYTVWGGGRKGGNLYMKVRKSDGKVISSSMSTR